MYFVQESLYQSHWQFILWTVFVVCLDLTFVIGTWKILISLTCANMYFFQNLETKTMPSVCGSWKMLFSLIFVFFSKIFKQKTVTVGTVYHNFLLILLYQSFFCLFRVCFSIFLSFLSFYKQSLTRLKKYFFPFSTIFSSCLFDGKWEYRMYISWTTVKGVVSVDRHSVDADPDQNFHFDAGSGLA